MCIQPCTQACLVLKQFHRIPLADLEMVLPGEGMKPSYRGGGSLTLQCTAHSLPCMPRALNTLLQRF